MKSRMLRLTELSQVFRSRPERENPISGQTRSFVRQGRGRCEQGPPRNAFSSPAALRPRSGRHDPIREGDVVRARPGSGDVLLCESTEVRRGPVREPEGWRGARLLLPLAARSRSKVESRSERKSGSSPTTGPPPARAWCTTPALAAGAGRYSGRASFCCTLSPEV
jgi:hypothetical protein